MEYYPIAIKRDKLKIHTTQMNLQNSRFKLKKPDSKGHSLPNFIQKTLMERQIYRDRKQIGGGQRLRAKRGINNRDQKTF